VAKTIIQFITWTGIVLRHHGLGRNYPLGHSGKWCGNQNFTRHTCYFLENEESKKVNFPYLNLKHKQIKLGFFAAQTFPRNNFEYSQPKL
jgi:hypothetical protein